MQFKLNDQQKIKFGKLAIAHLAQGNPKFPTNLAVDETGPASVIFGDQRAENTLAFTFEDYAVESYYYFIGYPAGSYSEQIQPLYLDYMTKTFGEPYRAQALKHWETHFIAEGIKFQQRREQAFAKLTAKFDREEKKIFACRHGIYDVLRDKTEENEKLRTFITPTMKQHATEQDQTLAK